MTNDPLSDRDIANWRSRLARVSTMARSIDSGRDIDIEELKALAHDPKWEVRGEVAKILGLLPDPHFDWFASRLAGDINAFVARTARRMVEFRKSVERERVRQDRESENIARLMARLETRLGADAMKSVSRICDHRVGQVVGAMVHDLRGVLTYLRASCQTLLVDSPHSARCRDNLTLLEQMIADMDSFTETAPLDRRLECLGDVVREATAVALESAKRGGIDVGTMDIEVDAGEAIRFPMVRRLVLMALVNVIKNSLEASPGRVWIRAEAGEAAVRVTVADNGVGIADDVLGELLAFRPGRRNKAKRYSTGFGLPIAARNLAAHEGTLAIQSTEGIGTTVTLTIPMASIDEEKKRERVHQGARGRRRSANCRSR